MNEITFGNWKYKASCSTEAASIYLIEMENGDKRWYGRFDLDRAMFLDAVPQDSDTKNPLMESKIYYVSISI